MVKQGYKQTEIGVIPEDWDVKNLIDLSDGGMQNGVFYEVSRKGSGVFFLNVGNLYETAPITTRALERFDATTNEIERFKVKHGDLFFTRSSIVPSGIAYCNWYKGEKDETTVFDSHVVRFKTDTEQVVPMYLYLQCISHSSRKYFTSNAKVATMTTIDQNQIGRCQIPVPTYDEQERIAEALSDVDSMISSLEKLIAKKKAIKQGAMQELLTGKKRLPGFTREWGKYKLGDLCCISGRIGFRGYTKNDLVNKGFGAITFSPSDIFEQKLDYSNCDYISFFKYDESPEIQVFNGDIIFCKTASIGKTALVKKLTEKATINPQFVLMNKFKCNNEFLYYIISGKEFVEQILSITGGSTIPTISQEQLKMQLVCMPELDEQTAIASILADMDNEIEALEQKLEKARHIKQGMMQQLLTGKIRLV